MHKPTRIQLESPNIYNSCYMSSVTTIELNILEHFMLYKLNQICTLNSDLEFASDKDGKRLKWQSFRNLCNFGTYKIFNGRLLNRNTMQGRISDESSRA